jgi:hypothetical protein
MARSYFSRLLRGGVGAPLLPPRPASNLWKAAQIDAATSTEAVAEGRRSTRQTGRVGPVAHPPDSPDIESRAKGHLGAVQPAQRASRSRIPRNSALVETARPAPAATAEGSPGHLQTRPAMRPGENNAGQAQSALASLPGGIGEILQRQFPSAPRSAAPVSSRAAQPAQGGNLSPHDRRAGVTAQRMDPIASNPGIAAPFSSAISRPASEVELQDVSADSGHAPAHIPRVVSAPDASSAARRLEPAGAVHPIRQRDPSLAGQHATAEEPRARANTVQIGKIEVQVMPPLASTYRPAQPPAPKGRLARGYSLWAGW